MTPLFSFCINNGPKSLSTIILYVIPIIGLVFFLLPVRVASFIFERENYASFCLNLDEFRRQYSRFIERFIAFFYRFLQPAIDAR